MRFEESRSGQTRQRRPLAPTLPSARVRRARSLRRNAKKGLGSTKHERKRKTPRPARTKTPRRTIERARVTATIAAVTYQIFLRVTSCHTIRIARNPVSLAVPRGRASTPTSATASPGARQRDLEDGRREEERLLLL